MKITHVAEIVNIAHVARILEAEICGAKNVRAILMYNHIIRFGSVRIPKFRYSVFRYFTRFGPPLSYTYFPRKIVKIGNILLFLKTLA